MLILIDGHNLIPKIPGLSLHDFDDEMKLIEMLQVYARVRRKRIEVIFDKAPAGQPRQRKHGTIQVRFARPGMTADEEIRLRLESLGGKARQCLVVSSDQRVQMYGRTSRAQVESSDNFANQVMVAVAAGDNQGEAGDRALGEDEVAMWMEIFKNRKK